MVLFSCMLMSFGFTIAVVVPIAALLVPVIVIFGLPIIEAWSLRLVGTTPGKALMALRVEHRENRNLTFREAVVRTLRVLVYGQGLFIPVVSAITMLLSLRELTRDGATRWDKDTFTVSFSRITPLRWALLGCLVLLLAIAGNVSDDLPDEPSSAQNATKT
jgi:hypothetical protein